MNLCDYWDETFTDPWADDEQRQLDHDETRVAALLYPARRDVLATPRTCPVKEAKDTA